MIGHTLQARITRALGVQQLPHGKVSAYGPLRPVAEVLIIIADTFSHGIGISDPDYLTRLTDEIRLAASTLIHCERLRAANGDPAVLAELEALSEAGVSRAAVVASPAASAPMPAPVPAGSPRTHPGRPRPAPQPPRRGSRRRPTPETG